MTKPPRTLYKGIAKAAGILAPEIEYHPKRKAYSIGIELKVTSGGFAVHDIGIYQSPEEAQERIAEDLKKFLRKYPDAAAKVSVLPEIFVATPREIAHNLLHQLAEGQSLPVTDETRRLAKVALEYLKSLEKNLLP
jgi:myo-inositol-1-phosphate synthase